MIENKFLYFKTYQDFKAKLDAGNISDGSIVFIDDKSIIWTHGKEFMCSLPVSDEFGDSTQTSVSQKALSDAFNRVWTKLEDITGESLTGISMYVTPEYFIGDDGCTVSIRVNSVRANGIFESVKFYINNELVKEFDTVE